MDLKDITYEGLELTPSTATWHKDNIVIGCNDGMLMTVSLTEEQQEYFQINQANSGDKAALITKIAGHQGTDLIFVAHDDLTITSFDMTTKKVVG